MSKKDRKAVYLEALKNVRAAKGAIGDEKIAALKQVIERAEMPNSEIDHEHEAERVMTEILLNEDLITKH